MNQPTNLPALVAAERERDKYQSTLEQLQRQFHLAANATEIWEVVESLRHMRAITQVALRQDAASAKSNAASSPNEAAAGVPIPAPSEAVNTVRWTPLSIEQRAADRYRAALKNIRGVVQATIITYDAPAALTQIGGIADAALTPEGEKQ